MTTMHSVNIDARKFSPSWWAIKFIRLYQLTLSLWLGRQCRFLPTCSHYAQQAIAIHGIWRGTWLGLKRIGRCHPFHDGGLDPVPAPSPARVLCSERTFNPKQFPITYHRY